ncbi:YggS family pyridoxal phosphate-dependent enzyme [Deinococcus yavapaiensis]|uniref:Alanine racemase N-terminal domain-containing protein n=1 Tax=Deinococcus yavapaiensis KR-236 TaxID=694435 RepID=A0A318SBR7_9DEIO|nr:YggS family pyridoxal phosphate-dependent enzyme [Deinococcus yavapaiensis]PYE56241.1 hypothetical protein DES52_10145 [Deinococcus yavapaiensis KR-236]
MSLPEVLSRIREAELVAERPSESVRLVAVTKGRTPDEIRAHVLAHGEFALAENRGQELRDKRVELPNVEWHFIGTLQTNKLKYLRGVTLIHTLTRADHAAELARLAESWGSAPDVLLQLHNGEPQKHGVQLSEASSLYHQVSLMGLRVRGVMIMAPEGDPEGADRTFADAERLAGDLGLSELSMGMSDDFPLAIRHGATLVRVGRALFS